MSKGTFLKPFFPLLFIYIALTCVLGTISYKFFITDFIYLENKQNRSNVTSLVHFLEENLFSLKSITNDYSKWDETYNFINNRNDIYIYENFRDDALTLEELNIDVFIFVDKNSKIVYSKYNKNIKLNRKRFEKFILNSLSEDLETATILRYDNKLLNVAKSTILRSDFSGIRRGYLISVKFLDDNYLNKEFKSIFDSIKQKNLNLSNSKEDMNLSLKYLKNVKVFISVEDDIIKNTIEIFNHKNEYLSTIIALNKTLIVNQGVNTIKIFNFIGAIIMFIVFIVIYQKQNLIIKQNELLNEKVEKRTTQLTRAYRTLKTKNQELYKLANTDSLTNIRNRANFFVESIKNLNKSNNENKKFAVIMIDIDYFKKINDNYGHNVGDKVLINFCKIVNSFVDKDMIFGRLGGEEFAISVFNKTQDEVYTISENIRKKSSKTIIEVENHKINFTISLGVEFKQSKDETIDEILHRADELLYKAKTEGRNRVIRVV